MLKKTIKFEDLDGNPVEEDFYFHFSKGEIAEMELSYQGGLAEYLQRVIDSKDSEKIIQTFKRFITESIGRRSDDNRRFIKSKEITEEFLQTDAYSVMFLELCTDAAAGAEFVRGIMPGGDKLELPEVPQNVKDLELPKKDETPAWIREDREPTDKELREMSPDELRLAFARKSAKQSNPE